MTIEQISNRLGALCAHGAAVLVAASALETSDTMLIRNRLIGYVVAIEDRGIGGLALEGKSADAKKTAQIRAEIKELVEMAIGMIGKRAA